MLYNFKVVQEYERAVIFRLGRLMQGGAKGPGKQFSSSWKKHTYFMILNFIYYRDFLHFAMY